MAKRRGGGGNRSAAAKKGWETRRRGGGAKSKSKATPKTTTARGRARTAEASARAAVKAGGGTKATRSLLTAQRARDFYKATGTGTKRSKSGGSAGSKPAASMVKGRPAKMSKAPANPAKQKYQAAKSAARELRMYRGGRTDATVRSAEAKVKRMESKRRSSRAR